ncbi:MAG TPA: hypothetical protein VIL35_07575, partial [Vicinamibacterales bacterium]
VWTHGFVDMWSPGYLAFMSSNHNGLVRMYETFGNGGATTMKRTVTQTDAVGQPQPGHTRREWYRPNPPYKEVEWSMRNNTNFMQTGVLTALQFTAAFPSVVLENFYLKSRNSLRSGRSEKPHGYVIPEGRDRTRAALLVNLLRRQGIEVGRAATEFKIGDRTFPAGSYVVKRDQPYNRLVKTLLEKQTFPEGNLRTYDDTGWTMGLMLNTEVVPIDDPKVFDVKADLLTADVQPTGTVSGARDATAYLVPAKGANAMITLRYRLRDLRVMALDRPWSSDGVEWPAGTFVLARRQGGGETDRTLRSAVEALGLDAVGVRSMPDAPMHEVDLPRLAVYSTWGDTQEVGWVRHALDQFEVPFDLIYKERVRRGDLRRDYDIILIPNQGRTGKGLVYDIEMRGAPLPYTKHPDYPSHGMYGESEDIRGGMGLEGVLELQKFLEAGGTIITLGTASFFPAEFGLSRTVGASRPSAQFYAPGPIVQAEILAPEHPLFYGYADRIIPVRYANGPLFQVPERDRAEQVLMRFVGGNASVLSGLMRGADEIKLRPAVVESPVGAGRLVLFATNPCYRWQNHGEFGMLFNALLHWNDRPAPPAGTPAQAGTATAGVMP